MELDIINHPAFWIVVAALSERVAASPLRENSIIQLVFTALNSLRPLKRRNRG